VKCDHNRKRRHVGIFDIYTLLEEIVRKATACKKGISEVLICQTKFNRQVQCKMAIGTNFTLTQIRSVKQQEDWCCWKIYSVDPWNSAPHPKGEIHGKTPDRASEKCSADQR
jgi:hypothetical protein